ncbi:MAG: excinuclease ATPase subunit [Burkholderiales bacterium]|nr:excinuclease ATPase subunit [Burkholderiales bacterium]
MKKLLCLGTLAVIFFFPVVSFARDTVHQFDFQSVVDAALKDGQLDGTVKFYLKGAKVPGKVTKTFSEDVSNKKTNAANKTDEEACAWALRSALIAFQDSAKRQNANAVVDIVSYYKKKEFSSATQYECHAGTFVSGVAIKGRPAIVK